MKYFLTAAPVAAHPHEEKKIHPRPSEWCYEFPEAQDLITNYGLISFEAARKSLEKAIKHRSKARISVVALCYAHDVFNYRGMVIEPNQRQRTYEIDAKHGF